MTDDRVTLPLTKTRAAADTLCRMICTDPWTGQVQLASGHNTVCLIPDLAERDAMMATTYAATSISGDCAVGEHPLCKGCACHCHSLKTGRMR